MSTTPNVTKVDSGAIFHELNPKLIWLVRIVNIITLVMVIIAVVLCIVQGSKENASYYLLVCNLVISGLVCIVVNWWYRNGDLGSEKYWFILLVGAVIFLQCITSDLYVYKDEEVPVTTTTTVATTQFISTTNRNLTTNSTTGSPRRLY